MKIFYDIPYIKGILKYVFIPVVVVLCIVGVALFIYSRKHKDHEDPHYNFVMNFWSSLIGIIVTGTILAIAIGFSLAMTQKMEEYGIVEEKKLLYYLLKYFIIIPIIFVVWYVIKLIKTICTKPKATNKEVSQPNSPMIEESKKENDLPSMEESLEQEMKEFQATETEEESIESLPSEEFLSTENQEKEETIENDEEKEMVQQEKSTTDDDKEEEVELISFEDE